MSGRDVASGIHLFSRFIQAHALTGRYCFPYCAETVYVRCVRGIRADGIEFHLIRYRVIYLVVAFSHRLLVLKRTVGVVVCGCRVSARIHLFSRFIQAHALAGRYGLSHRAESVDICRVRGVFTDRVKLHLFGCRVVDLVVAFAYCLLVEKRPVFVVVCCCRVGARIHPAAFIVHPA